MTTAAVVFPGAAEVLVCVTARLGVTARCECGWPLVTPTSAGPLAAPVVLDYLICQRKSCRAHCIVTVAPEPQ